MQELIHRTIKVYRLNPEGFQFIAAFIHAINKIILFTISPEDTTNNIEASADKRHSQTSKFENNTLSGAVKTVVWIAVSIGAALLLGQLN